jgi:excisionase family DNA binding protein
MSTWLTAQEAAAHLRVKTRTILAWARQGKIPAHALSGSLRVTYRFRMEELDALLTDAFPRKGNPDSVVPPSVLSANGGSN